MLKHSELNITCQGFVFDVQQPAEANFFNNSVTPVPVTPEIDLKNFIIDNTLNDITFDFTETDTDTSNKMYYVPSDFSCELTNIKRYSGDNRLEHFFKMGEDTTFIKYLIKVKEYGSVKMLFIVNQDALADSKRQTRLKLQAVGLEKEFKEHCEKLRLPEPNAIPWTQNVIFTEINQNVRQIYLKNILQTVLNFTFIKKIEIENSLLDWRVTETPFFYVESTSPTRIQNCKTSYERFYTAEFPIWDWLVSTFNSMIWVFYFTVTNEGLTLHIRNSDSIDLPVRTLDKSDIRIDYSVSKKVPFIRFKNIVIIDGYEDGADEPFFVPPHENVRLKGARIILVSNSTPENFNVHHFNRVDIVAGTYQEKWVNYSFIKYNGEDNYRFNLSKYTAPNEYFNFSISKSDTLFINAGSSNPEIMKVNFRTRQNTGHTKDVTPLNTYEMLYTGCAGQQLVRYDYGYPYHYSDYIKANRFKNNLKKFLYTRSNKCFEFSENQRNWNFFEQYKFTNIRNIGINDKFAPVKIKLNLFKKVTSYICQAST